MQVNNQPCPKYQSSNIKLQILFPHLKQKNQGLFLEYRQKSSPVRFTSGVSKICLTCSRLVMCQVYLEKDPRGRPSFLTNAEIQKHTKKRNTCSHTVSKLVKLIFLSKWNVSHLANLTILATLQEKSEF